MLFLAFQGVKMRPKMAKMRLKIAKMKPKITKPKKTLVFLWFSDPLEHLEGV